MKKILLAIGLIAVLASCSVDKDQVPDVSHDVDKIFQDPQVIALARAAAGGNVNKIDRLIKQGVDVNSSGKLGITPLWWAIRNQNITGFKCLLAHGANPNARVEALNVLELASSYDDSAFLEAVLCYKPDLNQIGLYSHDTPIHTAISYVQTKNLDLLIKAGVDLNSSCGSSPLIDAIMLGRDDFAYIMLRAGADPDKIRDGGRVNGRNYLVNVIRGRYIDPDSDAYIWRERVIRLLRAKGIKATIPPNEGVRTKPLPDDLK